MGEAVVRVRCQICRTVVIKTGTLQRFIYRNIRRYEQFPVAVVIEMRANIERVWPLVNNLGSRITEDLVLCTILIKSRNFILHFSLKFHLWRCSHYRTIECGTMAVRTSSVCSHLILHFCFLLIFYFLLFILWQTTFPYWVPPIMVLLVSSMKQLPAIFIFTLFVC